MSTIRYVRVSMIKNKIINEMSETKKKGNTVKCNRTNIGKSTSKIFKKMKDLKDITTRRVR